MKRYLYEKFTDVSHQDFPAFILGVSAGYCQRAIAGESGVIRTHMGKHNGSVMVAVYGTVCAIPPRKL
jgi:hypothetical protein